MILNVRKNVTMSMPDPKDINKAISREHHRDSHSGRNFSKLSGAKYFSLVDAKCGYWNVELTKNRAIYINYLQFTIWPLQISAHAI